MPRRSSSRARRSPTRKLVWARSPFAGTVVAEIGPGTDPPTRVDALAVFEASFGASPIGSTIVRTRGSFAVSSAGANTDIIHVRLTAYIGNNNEVTRAPDANDNSFDQLSMNRDYFMFEPFTVVGDAQEPDFSGSSLSSRLIDVKSSRKIEELNQTVIMDVSAFSPAAPAPVALTFVGDFSFLLMLP